MTLWNAVSLRSTRDEQEERILTFPSTPTCCPDKGTVAEVYATVDGCQRLHLSRRWSEHAMSTKGGGHRFSVP